jgi:CRISPR/Cas system-associated endoribonuclease Cas2
VSFKNLRRNSKDFCQATKKQVRESYFYKIPPTTIAILLANLQKIIETEQIKVFLFLSCQEQKF